MSLESLALFRIGIALVQLMDLVDSRSDRCAFFSEDGLIPLAELPGVSDQGMMLPGGGVYHFATTCQAVSVMFFVHTLSTLLLLFGLCSRSAACCCYIFLLSEHWRMPIARSGGDDLLCISCLWACLLPAGERWSVDEVLRAWRETSRAGGRAFKDVHSVGVLGAKSPLLLMYLSSALIKMAIKDEGGRSVWVRGTALQQALQCCEYQTYLGAVVLRLPSPLLTFLTWSTLALELSTLPLLLALGHSGRRPRAVGLVVLALIGFHLGAGACMRLGNLSPVSIANLMLFLPLPPREGSPTTTVASSSQGPRTQWPGVVSRGLAASLAVFTVIHALAALAPYYSIQAPEGIETIGAKIGLPPAATMFAAPLGVCGWWVLPAVTRDGRVVDAHVQYHRRGQGGVGGGAGNVGRGAEAPVSYARPLWPSRQQPSQLWHKFYESLSAEVPLPHDAEPNVPMRTQLHGLARFHCARQQELSGRQGGEGDPPDGEGGGDAFTRLRVEFIVELYAFASSARRDSVRRIVCWELDCMAPFGHASEGFRPVGLARGQAPQAWADHSGNSGDAGAGAGGGTSTPTRCAQEPGVCAVPAAGDARGTSSAIRPSEDVRSRAVRLGLNFSDESGGSRMGPGRPLSEVLADVDGQHARLHVLDASKGTDALSEQLEELLTLGVPFVLRGHPDVTSLARQAWWNSEGTLLCDAHPALCAMHGRQYVFEGYQFDYKETSHMDYKVHAGRSTTMMSLSSYFEQACDTATSAFPLAGSQCKRSIWTSRREASHVIESIDAFARVGNLRTALGLQPDEFGAQVWHLRTGHISYCSGFHFDPPHNLIVALRGHKRALLLHPAAGKTLKVDFNTSSLTYRQSPAPVQGFQEWATTVGMEQQPLALQHIFEEGDVLWLPSGWLHMIETGPRKHESGLSPAGNWASLNLFYTRRYRQAY